MDFACIILLLLIAQNCAIDSKTTPVDACPTFVTNKALLQNHMTTQKETLDNRLSDSICYWRGSTCYYCPTGLYCSDDGIGCCPKPNCNNKCGQYCVCPGQLCCENRGTCPVDHPNCCKEPSEACCRNNDDCCGNGCCSNNNRCCNDNKKSYYCIKDNNWYSNDDVMTENEGTYQDDQNLDYFKQMCELFADGTRDQNPNKGMYQFAAMTLNMPSKDDTSANKFDPWDIVFDLEEQRHNYASAPPLKNTDKSVEHAEIRIVKMEVMNAMLKWFGENRQKSLPQPPSVYLFTYLSPCEHCLPVIANLKFDLPKDTHVFVAWHLTYDKITQTKFLVGLEKFFEKGIRVVYNLDGLCFGDKNKPSAPLFQPTFSNAMKDIYSGTHVGNCNENEIEPAFVKFVNWIVWECKDSFDYSKSEKTKNNVANCLKKEIDSLNPKVDPCMNLPVAVQSWIESYWPTNTLLLLSPPLNPNAPTSISNDVNDLRGNYKPFCFQVNFEKL